MAVITQTTVGAAGAPVAVSTTTLGASDSLIYTAGSNQVLELTNDTGGTLTVKLDGSASTTLFVQGYGKDVDVSAGFDIALTTGQTKQVRLDAIGAWLQGSVVITGGAGVKARLWV